jgi:pectin methylesterase-like acyl-CoA thioesterase
MQRRIWLLLAAILSLVAVLFFQANADPARARVIGQATLAVGAPGLISYQGYLEDGAGQPFSGNADMSFAIYATASGGSALWQETQNSVSVGGGFFATQLGSVTPLTAVVFDDPTRYLEVTVNIGAGSETLPRQRLTAVPYAMQAQSAVQAQSAASVPWSGITDVPSDLGGGSYANVINVAQSGGDFTSVATALNSISNPSADNRYLVWVAPGTYTETELVHVRPYIHLRGAGPNVTVVNSTRTGAAQGEAAATARLDDNGRISAITIRNSGTGTFGIGIWSSDATRTTLIDNVVAEAVGTGGTGHYAVYLNDSEPTIRNSRLQAYGATGFGTGVNAALGSVNVSGGFPQPLIEDSVLLGGSSTINEKSCAGNSGTGFGFQYTNTAATIRDSFVCGDHRAIFGGVNGITRVEHAKLWVSSTTGAFLIEMTNAATVTIANSGVFYAGNKHTGTGNMTCVHSYLGNYTAASNGANSATACN